VRPRVAHGYMAAAVLVTLLQLGRSPLMAQLLRTALFASSTTAIVVGLRCNRTRQPQPWVTLAAGQGAFALEQMCWLANLVRGLPAAGPVGNTLDLIGYAITFVGGMGILRARTRRDLGGLLDTGVMSVALGTVIWEFLLYGKLTRLGVPPLAQAATLIQLLVTMAGLGILMRLIRTSAASPITLCYLSGAIVGAFGQIVAFPLLSPDLARIPGTLAQCAPTLAGTSIGAAALHPSMIQLTEPGPITVDRLSTRRMLMLGTALGTAPLSVGISQLLYHKADTLLLVVSTVTIVPLVMYRIRDLVAQRESAEAALAHRATHDSLTGLPNRAQFVSLVDSALRRLRDGNMSQVAILFCDLDGFKEINDTLGHSAGDHLLITVAQRLQDCVREGDIVSRFGGDEFLVLSENLTEAEVADRLSGRIAKELQRPITLGSTKATISASIGVAATTALGALTAEEIIRDADLAMYAAKRSAPARPRLSSRHVVVDASAPSTVN
jgi:diguanylate cyclase (GGDEF)-like protein